MTAQLSLAAERDRLAALEQTIERGLQTFVEVGMALAEIRDSRLYRSAHATFEDYCHERWGFVASRARQLIAAAESVTAVTVAGLPAPSSERQARELVPLLDQPEQMRETWSEALADHDGQPTAAQVRERVEPRSNDPATRAQVSYLRDLSQQAGTEPPAEPISKAKASKLIDQLRDGSTATAPAPWLARLRKLIEEIERAELTAPDIAAAQPLAGRLARAVGLAPTAAPGRLPAPKRTDDELQALVDSERAS